MDRAAHVHHHCFAGPHKHVDALAVLEAAPSALGAKQGVHLLLPARVPRVALGACTLAGAQPERLVLHVRQRQVAQGVLGSAHFARLEGAVLQDPLMLDAAPLAPGPNGDPLGANDASVRPPHVDVAQRLPGPVGRHPQAERLAPRAVQLPCGLIGPPFGGCDFSFAVASHLFGPSFNFGFRPSFNFSLNFGFHLSSDLRSDFCLHLSLGGAGEAARTAAAASASYGHGLSRSCSAGAVCRACCTSLEPCSKLSSAPHRAQG